MTEEQALKEFSECARYIFLNDDEGYYVCQGYKSIDSRKCFILWANGLKGLNIKE